MPGFVRHSFGNNSGRLGAAPSSPLRAALGHAGRRLLYLTVGAAAFLVTTAVIKPTVVLQEQPAAAVSQLDRLAADHACSPLQLPGRTMLLISTPAAGPQLLRAAATADEQNAQVDWLYDQHADFYGWCRP